MSTGEARAQPELPAVTVRDLPLVSVVVPAYNESAVLVETLNQLCEYMTTLEDRFRWEIIVVNDGSTDDTGALADAFAAADPKVRVLHHRVNFHLGQALRYAFNSTKGSYIAVIDCDLSYAPEHIGRMLFTMQDTGARIVVASPYAKGGKVTNVPFLRRIGSRGANRLLSLAAGRDITTLTGMVRVYDGPFVRSLDLKAMDTEVNTEIIYKARILRAFIVEIPAHLDWTFPDTAGQRRSSMHFRASRSTVSSVFSSFLFRPLLFFTLPGLILLAIATYTFGWCVWHVLQVWGEPSEFGNSGFTGAIQNAYNRAPHTFLITGVMLVLSIQLISLGIIAVQAKRYFEELFHLGTTVLRRVQAVEEPEGTGLADESVAELRTSPGEPGSRQ